MFSCIITLVAHCLLVTQSSQVLAYVAMVIMGIGYSTLACSLWVIIALVVPLHRQGTAYGVTQAIQNAGLGLTSYIAGVIQEADETYVWLEVFFIGWLSLAILTTAVMWFTDFRKSNYLFMSEKNRQKFVKTKAYFDFLHIDMPSELTGELNEGFKDHDQ